MQEPEKPVKVKGKDQIEYDADVAQRLQAELDKEAMLKRAREEEASKAANIAEWDDVQAIIDADYELAVKLQAEEQGEISIEESVPNQDVASLFLQNILDLYFKHFKLSEDVVNRILQVVLDLQHFKSSPFISAATILQSSSAIHHISNIDNYVHQIIKFQSILITSSHSLWSSQSFGHQKGVCPWLTENHFNSQYLKHWASQSFGT
ncbi:hypothetical protein Tco_1344946 [Tanacetum coccineum]